MARPLGLAILVTLAVIAVAVPANAQGISISPVMINLPLDEQTSILTLKAEGAVPIGIQARAFLWTQRDGQDVLTPTRDIVISPPVGTLTPGVEQIVRIVSRLPATDGERTYRVWIDQLPRPGTPGTVQINVRISLPVFMQPPVIVAPKLSARLVSEGGEQIVEVHNNGTRHVRLVNAVLLGSGGTAVPLQPKMQYVLAGSTMTLKLDHSPVPATTLQLAAQTESGPIKLPLTQGGG